MEKSLSLEICLFTFVPITSGLSVQHLTGFQKPFVKSLLLFIPASDWNPLSAHLHVPLVNLSESETYGLSDVELSH